MPRGARGEGTISLPDRDVTVLYTNRALMTAERQLGKSILAVAEGFASNATTIGDVAQLLLVGMQAARREQGGSPVTMDGALDVLDQAGFGAVAAAVMEAVAAVLGYSASADDAPNA